MKLRVVSSAVWLALFCFAWASPVWAESPTERIREAIRTGIQILEDPAYRPAEKKKEIIQRLREVVFPLFDFPEMAKRSLGPHWRLLKTNEKKEFVAIFTEFLEASYASRINLYDSQKVVFTNENMEGDFAEVRSKVISRNGTEYSMNYRLRKNDGEWKIYDVVAENISVLNNYRSQFNRVIVKSSYDELVRRLQEKTLTIQ